MVSTIEWSEPSRWLPALLAVAGMALCSCQTSPDRAFVRQLKARPDVASVRTDRDGTVHVRRTDGREMWLDAEDQRAHRFHYRQDGAVKLMVESNSDVPAELPAGVDAIMVPEGGLNYLPPWLGPTPSMGPSAEFAELQRDRIRGSWNFETGNDTAIVRRQLGEQLAAARLTMRPGVAPRPDARFPIVIDAGDRGGEAFVQLRMGARPRTSAVSSDRGTGARGEVYYEYRR